MKERRLNWGIMLLAGSLFLLGRDLAATTTFSELEADVYLSCRGNDMCEAWELLMGDFDGDGFDDVLSRELFGSDIVFFGDHFPAGGSVSSLRTTKIERVHTGTAHNTSIGDITGDERADIFHFRESETECDVTLGRPNPLSFIPLPSDLTIDGVSVHDRNQTAFGDVNGDGIKDFLSHSAGTAYVVFGSTSFHTFTSTISVTDPARVMRVLGVGIGGVASGDVNGDGIEEILIANQNGGGPEPGVVYVIRGSTSLPSVWDLGTRSADWTIYGEGVQSLNIKFAVDFTGDGKADLGVESYSHPSLLSGAELLSKGPVCVLTPGHANSLTPISFADLEGYRGSWTMAGDFDGDGRPDLCAEKSFSSGIKREIYLFLSHSFPIGSSLPDAALSTDIRFLDLKQALTMGDLNGDGKSDLIYTSETLPQLNVFYGFRPLENPHMVIQPRGSIQVRVQLVLSVDGEPTEMKISGDITDNFKDQWIPFQSRLEVTFSSEEEAKEVTAQFRNAFGRESAVVSAPWSVAVGNSGVVTGTNLLRPGGLVTFDCPVGASGSLRATVYDSNGELILDLFNQSVERGVYPVQWDGRNGQGYSVGKGVYFLVIDSNGERTKKEILIE